MMTQQSRTMRKGIKPLSGIVSTLTTPIFQRSGFINASLILDWETIVSPAFSHYCQALRVTFPKGQKGGGVLHVKASGSMALSLSYEEPQILERVNRYYGYQAVTRMVIHHGPLSTNKKIAPQPSPTRPLDPQKSTEIDLALSGLSEGPLKDSLRAFGRSVATAKE